MTQRLLGEPPTYTQAEGSIGVTVLLLGGPPLTVVATLMLFGSVPAAFLVYHIGWCLLVPAAISLAKGHGIAEHRERLGLRRTRDTQVLGAGGIVGSLMFFAILPPFLFAGDLLLGQADLAGQLAVWGVPGGASTTLFVYMLVFNSGAEELYWRGYVHERLSAWRDRWTAIGLTSGFFASYHYYTIASLVQDHLLAAAMTLAVFLAGVTWAVLRERYDSVYPAILAHVGATAGYMSVYVLWI